MEMRNARVASPIGVFALAAVMGGLTGCETGDMSRAEGAEASDAQEETEQPAVASADAPTVMIVEPANGAELDGPSVRILMTVGGIELAPAGDETPGTAHHHLFVNTPITPPGEPIPADVPGIIHLGQAQPEHELTDLEPGEYTVISVLGDLVHRRLDPQSTDTVRFTVRAP